MFNFNEIKQIPLDLILSDNGYSSCAARVSNYSMYHSPLHDDKHPSFAVDRRCNRWHDFALGIDGSNIDLIIRLGLAKDCGGAARYLAMKYPCTASLQGITSDRVEYAIPNKTERTAVTVTSVTPLHSPALRRYITEVRCIPPCVADKYLQEVHCRLPSGKSVYGAAIPNRSGGYALRNPYFKMAIPPVDVTLIPAISSQSSNECLVFEGMLSFLSLMSMNGKQDCDIVVLNSVTNIHRAMSILKTYTRIRCMLDNDNVGRETLEKIKSSLPDIKIVDESWRYDEFNDLNDKLINYKKTYDRI